MRRHISGGEATRIAIESDKRGPVQIGPSPEAGTANVLSTTADSVALVPASTHSAISLPSAPQKKRIVARYA
jgi:hypothetical protein